MSNTPKTDAKALEIISIPQQGKRLVMWKAHSKKMEREATKWRKNFLPFAAIYMSEYGEKHFGKGFMHPEHYDLLKESGARMDAWRKPQPPTES